MPDPTWTQIAAVFIALLVIFGSAFRILLGGWVGRREKVEADLAMAVEKLAIRHEADVTGLRESFFSEIQVIRESWHTQNREIGLLMGKLSNQVETLKETVEKLGDARTSLERSIGDLAGDVRVLTDRIYRREDDKRHGT